MSDDSTDQSEPTVNPETGKVEQTDAVEEEADLTGPNGHGKRQNLLSRPTDYVERPGFRNPANVRSKASRKKRKKNG